MDDCADGPALHEPLLHISAHIVPGQRTLGSSGACVLPLWVGTEEVDCTGGLCSLLHRGDRFLFRKGSMAYTPPEVELEAFALVLALQAGGASTKLMA